MTDLGKRELYRIQRDLSDEKSEDLSAEEEMYSIAGCTMVVAVIRDNVLIVANAGDSRCVIAK